MKNRKTKPGQLERRENAVGYLFILPWLVGLVVLVLWPIVQSFQFSLNKIRQEENHTENSPTIDFLI